MNYIDTYEQWNKAAFRDQELRIELDAMTGNNALIEDAFYKNLDFGTGGLRGVIGVGTNRMNVHTIGKATQGVADYIIAHFAENERSVAISYDSRIKSDLFARTAAEVFAANEIQVFIYPQLMPTPCLSYAVRALHCAAGVMVTASHNPAKYNGYKVYGPDGCQITTEAADAILCEINKVDIFSGVQRIDFDEGVQSGIIRYIDEDVYAAFTEEVKAQSMLGPDDVIDKNVSIVYSPLNGTGLKPVLRVLNETGFTNIHVVPEQEQPDGHFPTCPYPNPEIREAMALGIANAQKYDADLLLATDPDCDRVGIAVKNNAGEFVLLNGNETGMLLLDYICARRTALGRMPEDPVAVKTIVTIEMAERIAKHYGVRMVNVLTGFKFIGETIARLEKQCKTESYIFGFEESYGYLSGTYVRDKDAVDGAYLICEMFAYYKTQGISLLQKLQELYTTYGYCLNTLHSYEFEGSVGFTKMQNIMQSLRGGCTSFGGKTVIECQDYMQPHEGMPKSDVLKFILTDNCSLVVRPSGTEPKMKAYISVSAPSRAEAEVIEKQIHASVNSYLV